jgi:uncharacterized membrane protein (UPF0127 family)
MKQFTLILASLALAAACGSTPALFPMLQQAKIQAKTEHRSHEFSVWIAADDASQQRGLMFVHELPPDRGMLFLFERPRFAGFWMKDTYLSLDIVFIREDGVITNIAHDTKPLSLDPIESNSPVKGVLELVAGTAASIGLTAGDRIVYPAFAERRQD